MSSVIDHVLGFVNENKKESFYRIVIRNKNNMHICHLESCVKVWNSGSISGELDIASTKSISPMWLNQHTARNLKYGSDYSELNVKLD